MSTPDPLRKMVREEILTTLGAVQKQAEGYDGGEIAMSAMSALASVLDGAFSSLSQCWGPKGHEFATWWGEAREECRRCGTPQPDPFETKEDGA